MQVIPADILRSPRLRPVVAETTALGAAYAAGGIDTGFWNDLGELCSNWQEDSRGHPNMDEDERARQPLPAVTCPF
jgi:glycerol kinase